MFLGLYTLYGGIVIVYENIPACFKWVYYTNPGQCFPLLQYIVPSQVRCHGHVARFPARRTA